MRRVRFGWCSRGDSANRGGDQSVHRTGGRTETDETGARTVEDTAAERTGYQDLEAVRRADEQLDAAGRRETPAGDPTLQMLAALAADVDDDGSDTSEPRGGVMSGHRRLLSRAALTTGFTVIALSGTGIAAATVGGVGALQPLQQAVQSLYDTEGEVSAAEVRALLERARSALDAGRYDEAQRALSEARRLQASMNGSAAARLAAAIDELEWRLSQALAGRQPISLDSASESASQRETAEPDTSAESRTPADRVTDTAPAPTEGPGQTSGESSDGPAGTTPQPSTSPPDSPSPSPSPAATSGDGGHGGGGEEEGPGAAPNGNGRSGVETAAKQGGQGRQGGQAPAAPAGTPPGHAG